MVIRLVVAVGVGYVRTEGWDESREDLLRFMAGGFGGADYTYVCKCGGINVVKYRDSSVFAGRIRNVDYGCKTL